MSVVVSKKPFELVPAWNDIWFSAVSTETLQPNFKFYITITETNSGEVGTYRVDSFTCRWNAYDFVKTFIQTCFNFGQDGFFDCALSGASPINEFTVNIGEEYGSTPAIHPGTDYTFYAWNASLTKRERAEYLPTQYDNSTTGPVWLQACYAPVSLDYERNKVKRDQDVIFQFIQTGGVPVDEVEINVYDSSANLLNNFVIDNSLGSEWMIGFNAGIESLEQYYIDSPGAFTTPPGSTPLFPDDAAYYNISFSNANGFNIASFEINEECTMYYNKTLMYLNRFGGYDYVNLYGDHKKKHNVIRTNYKRMHDLATFQESYIAGTSTVTLPNNPLHNPERALAINYEATHTLKSNWLTDLHRINLSDLISTPHVFFNFGYQDYQILNVSDDTFQFTQPLIEKLYQLVVNVREAMERRQGG